MPDRTTLERAFDLARSGQCHSVSDIKKKLRAERYSDVDGQLHGLSIGRTLRKLLAEGAGNGKAQGDDA